MPANKAGFKTPDSDIARGLSTLLPGKQDRTGDEHR
jgi:hypothetical protein